jgi:hypothetical protein
MDSTALLPSLMDHLGGKDAFYQYVATHRTVAPPATPSGPVLMDYRPEGSLVLGRYEDHQWWDGVTQERVRRRPHAWVPLPPGYAPP